MRFVMAISESLSILSSSLQPMLSVVWISTAARPGKPTRVGQIMENGELVSMYPTFLYTATLRFLFSLYYGGQNFGKEIFHVIREAMDNVVKEYQERHKQSWAILSHWASDYFKTCRLVRTTWKNVQDKFKLAVICGRIRVLKFSDDKVESLLLKTRKLIKIETFKISKIPKLLITFVRTIKKKH